MVGPQHGDVVVLRAMAALEDALALDRVAPVGRTDRRRGWPRSARCRSAAEQVLEQGEVLGHHPLGREVALDRLARQAARSSWSIRPMASAMSATSRHRKPVMPSSTISGAAPSGKVSTGVPHAMASIITRPNGSGQRIGFSRARAPARSSQLLLRGAPRRGTGSRC